MNFQKEIILHDARFWVCALLVFFKSFFSVVIDSKQLGWQALRDTLGRTIIPDLC